MASSLENLRLNKRMAAYTAAAIYGASAVDGVIEGFLPGDPAFSLAPVLIALVIAVLLLVAGSRLPWWGLSLLGPLGVILIASAVATTPGPGDGAVLYAMPVLWTSVYFGRRGAAAILACVAAAHAIALLELPPSSSYPGRWMDVMVAVAAISLVVLVLERRNELLVTRLTGEARTDALTGLLNRRGFDERARIELAHAKRESRSIAITTFDIDHFKHINDEWGHPTGDQVLAWIGTVLAAECRDIDVPARLGGEEFVVLLPGVGWGGAEAFTERVRQALAAGDASSLPVVRVSAGIDVAATPENIETMLRIADSALYQAKRTGRNRTVTSRAQRARAGALS
ncbi:MAG TPA: GGDEF domain-containing protein [Solirubrobacteraceae bacterium]|nr:GGDEF domain-containing protein [Solirubrobacteraceae bacterium]